MRTHWLLRESSLSHSACAEAGRRAFCVRARPRAYSLPVTAPPRGASPPAAGSNLGRRGAPVAGSSPAGWSRVPALPHGPCTPPAPRPTPAPPGRPRAAAVPPRRADAAAARGGALPPTRADLALPAPADPLRELRRVPDRAGAAP